MMMMKSFSPFPLFLLRVRWKNRLPFLFVTFSHLLFFLQGGKDDGFPSFFSILSLKDG